MPNDPLDSAFGMFYKGRKADYPPDLPYDPPARFEPRTWTPVASLTAAPGEGADVAVFEFRCPADFFRICVAPSYSHAGKLRPGCVLCTGSGEGELALRMAQAFAEGVLVLDEVNVPAPAKEEQHYRIIGANLRLPIGVCRGEGGKSDVLAEEPAGTTFEPISKAEFDAYDKEHYE